MLDSSVVTVKVMMITSSGLMWTGDSVFRQTWTVCSKLHTHTHTPDGVATKINIVINSIGIVTITNNNITMMLNWGINYYHSISHTCKIYTCIKLLYERSSQYSVALGRRLDKDMV